MPDIAPYNLLTFVAGSALSLLHLLLLAYISFAWVTAVFPRESIGIKICCFITACYWIPCALFVALIPFGLFNRVWSTLAFLLLALGAHFYWRKKGSPPLQPQAVLPRVQVLWQELPRATKAATFAVLGIFIIRLARGLIAPPMAWDSLTYHLLKAGRWVQSGRWVRDNAPDSWQFYEYFPPLGDVYWAWAMLGSHSDAWIALAGGLVWLSCAPGIYVLARLLGADVNRSWLASLAAISVPACLALVTSAYVDNTPFALVMAGSVLALGSLNSRSSPLAATGAVAFALAVGIKITFLPYLAIGLLLFGVLQLWTKPHWKYFLPFAAGMLIALFWQVYLVGIGKTPFFPAPFSLAGISVEKGLPEFIAHHFFDVRHIPYLWEIGRSLKEFFWGIHDNAPNHLNFTPFVLLFAAVGLCGFGRKLRSLPWRHSLLLTLLLGAGLLIFANFWAPSTTFYRLAWAHNMARFFLTFYAMLSILGIFIKGPVVYWAYVVTIFINCAFSFPQGWGWLDVQATVIGIGLLLLLALAAIPRTHSRRLLLLLAAVIYVPLTFVLRDTFRYQFYKNAHISYDVFRAGLRLQGGAAEYLDGDVPLKIAFNGDRSDFAYRWFRYIFLGSRLQNTVVYIPPTKDGSTWSQSLTAEKETDYNLWKRRLETAGIDYFVAIEPYPIELYWIIEHKEDYHLALTSPGNHWAVIKVRN